MAKAQCFESLKSTPVDLNIVVKATNHKSTANSQLSCPSFRDG